MSLTFTKATKKKAKLRLALIGPAGSGKTYSALSVATHLGEKVAVVDTEHGSASLYSDMFNFDAIEPTSYDPRILMETIGAAEAGGYDVLIIDSLSHYWMGKDGFLEQVDRVTAQSRSKNAFSEGWRAMSPVHNQLIDRLLAAKLHVICTARAKTEYVMEENSNGKKTPTKIGMAPVLRDGMEYEFDMIGDLALDNTLIVSKSRCPQLSGKVIQKPGKQVADTLKAWLDDGAEPPKPPEPTPLEKLKKLLHKEVGCKSGEDASLVVRWALMDPRSSAPKYSGMEALTAPEAAKEVYDTLVTTDAAPGGSVKFNDMLRQARQLTLEAAKEPK